MAEYIDREKLEETLKGFGMEKNSIMQSIIARQEIADVIERSVIEDIKAEIDKKTEMHADGEFYIKNIDVKKIIDAHISEQQREVE